MEETNMSNFCLKHFVAIVIMFFVSFLLTLSIYEAGRSSGKVDVLFNSQMWVEGNSILIEYDGEVYEHLVD